MHEPLKKSPVVQQQLLSSPGGLIIAKPINIHSAAIQTGFTGFLCNHPHHPPHPHIKKPFNVKWKLCSSIEFAL